MPVFRLTDDNVTFPPAWLADESGILAIGGDLSLMRVLEAYKNGIFPWFNEDEPPIWWSPDPRFVLYPENLRISKSMRQVLRKQELRVSFDTAFEQVMRNCQMIYRPGQEGSWISEELIDTFVKIHHMGIAHSVEVWQGDELVGGLYGSVLGHCFFGESMFAKRSNASKVGFITLVKNLQQHDFELIDCQVHTSHLESLGASYISRDDFLDVIFRNQHEYLLDRPWNEFFSTTVEL